MRPEDEPGISPGPASPEKKSKQARGGRAVVLFIAGVAVAAFLFYVAVALYAAFKAG